MVTRPSLQHPQTSASRFPRIDAPSDTDDLGNQAFGVQRSVSDRCEVDETVLGHQELTESVSCQGSIGYFVSLQSAQDLR